MEMIAHQTVMIEIKTVFLFSCQEKLLIKLEVFSFAVNLLPVIPPCVNVVDPKRFQLAPLSRHKKTLLMEGLIYQIIFLTQTVI